MKNINVILLPSLERVSLPLHNSRFGGDFASFDDLKSALFHQHGLHLGVDCDLEDSFNVKSYL